MIRFGYDAFKAGETFKIFKQDFVDQYGTDFSFANLFSKIMTNYLLKNNM